MNESTQGRRVYARGEYVHDDGSIDLSKLQLYDYIYCPISNTWYAIVSGNNNGFLVANISKHTIEVHDDETITVSPSILVKGNGQWHGYLERGVFREC